MKRLATTTEQTELIYVPSTEEIHLYESGSFTTTLDSPAITTGINQPVPRPSNWSEGFQPLEEPERLSAYGCFIP